MLIGHETGETYKIYVQIETCNLKKSLFLCVSVVVEPNDDVAFHVNSSTSLVVMETKETNVNKG